MKEKIVKEKKKNNVDLLLNSAMAATGKTFDEIRSKDQSEELVFIRRTIAVKMSIDGYIDEVIAGVINRSRTNVVSMKKTFEDDYKYNNKFREVFDKIEKEYKESIELNNKKQ